MLVTPQPPRYRVERLPTGVRIEIPSPRNWLTIVLVCAWLGLWLDGTNSAIRQVIDPIDQGAQVFISLWLVGWTFGGAAALGIVLWQLFGSEVVEVANGTLRRRIRVGPVANTREYDLSQVKLLRVQALDAASAQAARWMGLPFGRTAGPVVFDHGYRTVRFGSYVDDAEAKGIVEVLAPFLPDEGRTP